MIISKNGQPYEFFWSRQRLFDRLGTLALYELMLEGVAAGVRVVTLEQNSITQLNCGQNIEFRRTVVEVEVSGEKFGACGLEPLHVGHAANECFNLYLHRFEINEEVSVLVLDMVEKQTMPPP